jgi:molybdate transport system ATP-binding protein
MSPALVASMRSELREFTLDIEITVEAGRCLALVGPSGAGKSTILRAIAGLHRPDGGHVTLGSTPWLDREERVDLAPERRSCGYLFQDYALFGHLSVWRNVAFGLDAVPRGERRGRALSLLDRFGVASLADASVRELSGGERQRVALARALARDPDVLLLDEPLAALDPRTASSASRELARTIAEAGAPTVLVTHDFGEAALLADEVAVIDRGRIIQSGPPAELSSRPTSAFVADFAGAAVLLGEAVLAGDGTTLVRLDGGGELTSTDLATGPVAVAIFPWEIALEPAGTDAHGSALNRLAVTISSVTEVGNRARVGLSSPQSLVAEVTGQSVRRLGLAPGTPVIAAFKATATRLVER